MDSNFDELIGSVKKYTKKNFQATIINGKMAPNVANLGGKRGEIAKLMRHGEYHGISVEFMENLRPLLTDRFIIKILTLLKTENYHVVLQMLELTNLSQLKYVLSQWFQIAFYEPIYIFENTKSFPELDEWIRTVRKNPLLGKIKIVEIGHNEKDGCSVVPAKWMGREFENGHDLHEKMNHLENRISKPPVTYAIIYSMVIQKNQSLVENVKMKKYKYMYYVDFKKGCIQSNISHKILKNYQHVEYGDALVGFVLQDILEPKITDDTIRHKSGYFVSVLQKSIRRGRYGSRALIEAIDSLNSSQNYNLPEHGFARVSTSKQLVWRLYVTILEDCRPYQQICEMGLLDLMFLVLITQKLQEYKFKKNVLNAIKLLALAVQYNDDPQDLHDWRSLSESTTTEINLTSDFHTSISLAVENVIMMKADKTLLRKYYSETIFFEPLVIPEELKGDAWNKVTKRGYLWHDDDVYHDIITSSMDHHVKPQIILYYQACIPVSLSTRQISGHIWTVSSRYNVRRHNTREIDEALMTVQEYLLKSHKTEKFKNVATTKFYDDFRVSQNHKRMCFLILFGKKYRHNGRDVVLTGTVDHPARIKINNKWILTDDPETLNKYGCQIVNLKNIDPPIGYAWQKFEISTEIKKGYAYINDVKVPYFDGSSALRCIRVDAEKINASWYDVVIKIISGGEIDFETLTMLREKKLQNVVNWYPKKCDLARVNMELIKLVYTKIFNNMDNVIIIGPVSRSGKKMNHSINYYMEGKIWAVFNLFSFLYSDTITLRGSLNFNIYKTSCGYVHLIETLRKLLFPIVKINGTIPIVKTKLWDHQTKSCGEILTQFTRDKYGYGDASDVGSGKTLISLNVAVELIKKKHSTFSGILVLLPGIPLIKTWMDELKKHTHGFDVIIQQNKAIKRIIQKNTIIITTLARMRDHPMNHNWLLTIIDECLSVQNKNALWTEEAWKQSLCSQHLIMMSATFFRTRFDKLYYMLKMLNTGIPEKKEYLDTILTESITSQISESKRKWTSNFNYFELDETSREKYDEIYKSDLGTEQKFMKLQSLLITFFTKNKITKQLKKLIIELEKKGRRCLIYARGKREAEFLSDKLEISIYPIKHQHCIITLNKGTYGLNDLVIYDTIIMSPPSPDIIPQIKGRLDRPGQEKDDLMIEYYVIKDTIEEGLILRLNMASHFADNYILPLAEFYDLSLNYQHHK